MDQPTQELHLGGPHSVLVVVVIVPLACFAVMTVSPRARPRRSTGLLWLGFVMTLALLSGPQELPYGSIGCVAIISLAGLVRLTYDPRLAIACGLAWAAFASGLFYAQVGLHSPNDWIAIAAPAAVILIAATCRLSLMRRSAPGS